MKTFPPPGVKILRRAYALLLFLLLAGQASVAQRIVRERAFASKGMYSTEVVDMVVSAQGNVALALGSFPTPTGYHTGSYRLLTPSLDTLWTLTGLVRGLGRNPIRQLPSGEFIGGVLTDVPPAGECVEKISASGKLLWRRPVMILTGQQLTIEMAPLPDNGWLNVMWGPQAPAQLRQRSVLYKSDSAGTVVWQRPYGWDATESVLHLQRNPVSGRILLAGTIPVVGGQPGAFEYKLLLVNAAGDSLRGRRLAPLGPGTSVRTQAGTQSLLPLPDGGWLLTGSKDSAVAAPPQLVLRLDSLLQPVFTAVFRSPPGLRYQYTGSCALRDGSVLVLARLLSGSVDVALHRYSPAGRLLAVYHLPGSAYPQAQPHLLVPAADGRTVFVAGYCDVSSTDRRGYVAAVDLQGLPDALPLAARAPAPPARAVAELRLYPVPARTQLRAAYRLPASSGVLALYDGQGRRVAAVRLPGAHGEVSLPVAGLAQGLYVCRLEVGGQALLTRNVVVLP